MFFWHVPRLMKGVLILAVAIGGLAMTQESRKEVRHTYDGESGTVTLLGVCAATEQEGYCWGPDGKPFPELTDRFDAAYKAGKIALTVRYGSKFRVAFFGINDKRSDASFHLEPVGSTNNYHQYESVLSSPSGDNSRYQGVAFDVPKDAKEGVVAFSYAASLGTSPRLKFAVGEKMSFLGATFEVVRIGTEAAETRQSTGYGTYTGKSWAVALRVTRTGTRNAGASWSVVGQDGLSVGIVDGEGKPAFVDASVLYSYNRPDSTPKYVQAAFGGTADVFRGGPDIVLGTNVNPTQIKEVCFSASEQRNVWITGIPLDPAR